MEEPTRYAAAELLDLAAALLSARGMEAGRARAAAGVLLDGDLLGHTTHGLALLPRYLDEIANGTYRADGTPTVVSDSGAAFTWDGGYLLGPWLVVHALDTALERISSHPVVTAVLRRCGHIACLASYVLRAAERGFICLLVSSDPAARAVAPHGSYRPVYTPDPIAAAFPTENDPVVLDFSVSTTSMGVANRMADAGLHAPGPWFIDPAGRTSTDPAVCRTDPPGALLPLGGSDLGYKGFALALLFEALTSALGGYGRADGPSRWGASVFLQLLDPTRFAGAEAFRRETQWLADACRAAPPAPGTDGVRLPGQRGLALRRRLAESGVQLPPGVAAALRRHAETAGVPFPSPIAP